MSGVPETFAIPGAGGLIRSVRNGRPCLLLQDRVKAGAPDEAGLIEIPAGKIRAFENIYACLRREIREETGCEVTWIQGEAEACRVAQHGYEVLAYVPYASSQNLAGSYPIMVQTFLCEVDGDPLAQSDESRDIRWVDVAELARLLDEAPGRFYPMHLAALRRYVGELVPER